MYYSKSKNAFYASEFQADYEAAGSWPADAIEISDADYAALMNAHAEGQTIQPDVNGNPVSVAPSLDTLQGDVWNDIKTKRNTIQNGGVQVATSAGVTKWFQTDPDSRVQYLGLKDTARDMLAAGHVMTDALQVNNAPVEWKTYDNSFVALTLQNAYDIVAAVKTLDALAFANAETHRQNMLAAADPLTYDYSTGWPPVYVAA